MLNAELQDIQWLECIAITLDGDLELFVSSQLNGVEPADTKSTAWLEENDGIF